MPFKIVQVEYLLPKMHRNINVLDLIFFPGLEYLHILNEMSWGIVLSVNPRFIYVS
jgi:hypothetical protein